MLAQLIKLTLENRFLVLIGTLLMAAAGINAAVHLPIDAVPDMTNVQVTVITSAGSLSPVEVERYVTQPVEVTMGGLPKVEELRSISRFGISVVTIVFREGTDIYRARQLVAERLSAAASLIPNGYGTPELGPLTTALGEILQFEVRGEKYSPTQLRTMLEWDVAPRLREVPGVTEINTHGGFYKAWEIQPDPELLNSYSLTFEQLFAALESNNVSAGGGYVVHHGEQRFLRGQALVSGLEDLEQIVIRREPGGTPVLIRDVAQVREAPLTRQGAVTRDARGEAVTGLVMMLIGENSREVVGRVKERLAEIQTTMPEGVKLEVTYDRSALIGRTLKTVVKNLIEGGTLVIAVLLIMLGSLRAGLITALAIPLSMLFATSLMQTFGVTASLMSLGAIDFGLIVDYNGMLKSLREALAQYALGDDGGEAEIVAPIEERVAALADAIAVTEAHLMGLGFDASRLVGSKGFARIGLLADAVNVVYTSDETKRRYEILSRVVFSRFKALLVEPSALVYAERHDNIEAIYKKLSERRDTADVSELLKELRRIVNEAIATHASGVDQANGLTVDLSQINMEKLRDEFASKVQRKATAIEDIRQIVEEKLAQMLAQNPLRMNYEKKYQEIIAAYNQDKDRATIEDTFAKLLDVMAALDVEQNRNAREGLSEDQLALFDLVQRGDLNKSERERIKQASRDLLAGVMAVIAPLDRWTEKEQTQAEVETFIMDQVYLSLPEPPYTPQDKANVAQLVYQHIRLQSLRA